MQAKTQARLRQEPDADGFITVTRGARAGPARQEAAQEQAKKQKEKQKGLDDFYRFQMRERKKAEAGELVRRFEQDKEKVKRMREQRGMFEVRSLSTCFERWWSDLFSLNETSVHPYDKTNDSSLQLIQIVKGKSCKLAATAPTYG